MSTNGKLHPEAPGPRRILFVTPIEGIQETVASLSVRLPATVDIAPSQSAALRMLERKSYAVVVLDQMLADADPEGTEVLWKRSGLAIPIPVSLAIAGSARLERDVRAALARREREQELAREAASAAVDAELKNALTVFLLEAQLALREVGIPPLVADRLRTIESVADRTRASLQGASASSPDRGMATGNLPQ